jgi:LPXTG-motif cell wall-anchored protein
VRDNATGETVATGANAAGEYDDVRGTAIGDIKFSAIPYTTEDIGKTFTYTISEYIPVGADVAITYDETSVYTATVVVGVQNGEMTFDVTIVDENDTELGTDDKMTFENEFEDVTEVVVYGTKDLFGRPFRDGDDWTFTVTAVNGGPIPDASPLTIHADENPEFEFVFKFSSDDLIETDPESGVQTRLTTKDFEYTITESGDVVGIKNDDEPKHVKIRLTSLSGHVSAIVVDEDTDELVWHNRLVDGIKLPGTGSLEALWFVLAGLCVIATGLVLRRRLLRKE